MHSALASLVVSVEVVTRARWTRGTRAPPVPLVIVLAGLTALMVGSLMVLQDVAGDDAPSAGDPVRLEHVHGLDPADGAFYAGTHYGLIRIDKDGSATRVADRVQDFMGFTVVGPTSAHSRDAIRERGRVLPGSPEASPGRISGLAARRRGA